MAGTNVLYFYLPFHVAERRTDIAVQGHASADGFKREILPAGFVIGESTLLLANLPVFSPEPRDSRQGRPTGRTRML